MDSDAKLKQLEENNSAAELPDLAKQQPATAAPSNFAETKPPDDLSAELQQVQKKKRRKADTSAITSGADIGWCKKCNADGAQPRKSSDEMMYKHVCRDCYRDDVRKRNAKRSAGDIQKSNALRTGAVIRKYNETNNAKRKHAKLDIPKPDVESGPLQLKAGDTKARDLCKVFCAPKSAGI